MTKISMLSKAALTSRSRAWACLGLAVAVGACTGEIGQAPGVGPSAAPGGHRGSGSGPGVEPGDLPPGARPPENPDGTPVVQLDVNRVAVHRLNKTEYDNTMKDLLGVAATPAKGFIDDEKLLGFDNIATALGMTDAQYEQYFNAADALVTEVFASEALRRKIVTCTGTDAACAKTIITNFGLRAYRRPLTDAELTRFEKLRADAIALGEDFNGSIAQVVRTMLSSAPFLYRVEFDADPASVAPHAVGAYEMASRLSYLLWSTLPDDALLDAAKKGTLLDASGLSSQVDRLLTDARSSRFLASFAGQWLGVRELSVHQADDTVFPSWNDALRKGMVNEELAYFDEFLGGSRTLDEFFTSDVNFVDDALARHYGLSAPGNADGRVTATSDQRRGFLGLAGFLTMTSFSYRTAPTLRGKWVLENLLCQKIPDPPPNVGKLDDAAADPAALQSQNVRKRLEAHRVDPTCANCHKVLDPIGLGLEHFDGIGKYRPSYSNGEAIDASGELPDGTAFEGLTQLSDALAGDERLMECASKKLMTYALSRELVATDTPYLQQVRTDWAADGLKLAALLKRIVLSDTFRFRRGETP